MAIKTRTVYTKPSITIGSAGYQFNDPTFGSWMLRVTDAATMTDLGQTNYSYRTPSAAYQRAWSVDSSHFYVQVSGGSAPILYDFNTSTRVATKRSGTINFQADIAFHDSNPNFCYGPSSAAGATNHHTIVRADVSSGTPTYSLILDLDSITNMNGDTYIGSVSVQNNILMAICGAVNQGDFMYVVWYPLANPSAKKFIDTRTQSGPISYTMHSAQMDITGRYVDIVPSAIGGGLSRNYIWDTTLDTVTGVTDNSGGHESLGVGRRVNQDYFTDWDQLQWIVTPDLGSPNSGKYEVISPVLTPPNAALADHNSWNHDQAGTPKPFVSETYRIGGDGTNNNPYTWRCWDDEIISVQCDNIGHDVWRHCHHRTQNFFDAGVADNGDYFYYTPRANVSPDGRWILFTSNWDKSLGIQAGWAGHRQDVFMVERTLDANARAHRRARRLQ